MEKNLLLVHGGGPTAVINASVYGVIMEAKRSGGPGRVYGAIGGTKGILEERFVELSAFDDGLLRNLLHTPASAIGSSRFALSGKDYVDMTAILQGHGIGYVLMNGGNGTMDTCGRLYRACRGAGIGVVGIPKTVDNDIACIDHAPGYGSAARFIASCAREIGEDVKSLPIHVSVIEAMGRNAGWITAAAALAREKPGDAPHLIYVPEKPFDEEAFLRDVKRLYEEKGGVVAVVSEGLRNSAGESVVPPIFRSDRAVYYGDVGAYLAELVIRRLGIKARNEKPGLLGRASIAYRSETDCREAEWMGREAVRAVLDGETGVMVGVTRRENTAGYEPECIRVPVERVMLEERRLPDGYIGPQGNDVTDGFVEWCRPLAGDFAEPYLNFRDYEPERR